MFFFSVAIESHIQAAQSSDTEETDDNTSIYIAAFTVMGIGLMGVGVCYMINQQQQQWQQLWQQQQQQQQQQKQRRQRRRRGRSSRTGKAPVSGGSRVSGYAGMQSFMMEEEPMPPEYRDHP